MKIKELLNKNTKATRLVAILCLAVLVIGAGWFLYKGQINKFDVEGKTITDVILMFDNGQKQEAIELAEDILAHDPNNEELQKKLAILYYQNGDKDKFMTFVSDHNIQNYIIFNMMANIYKDRGENDQAEENYKKAIDSNQKSIQGYVTLSAYYQANGHLDLALQTLKNGLLNNNNSVTLLISAASVSIKAGEKDQAKDYLNKVLSISPDNEQAKAILNSI